MKTITLSDLTDDQLASKSELMVNMVRSRFPNLDLRRGTVLRDLLVDTDAAIAAWFSEQADEQRKASSLSIQARRAKEGEEVDPDDVNAILSNFNMKSVEGTKAKGYVRVVVKSGNSHSVLSGLVFKTADGVSFASTEDVTASMNPVEGETRQYKSATGWWYLVPVEAVNPGLNGNLPAGTALEPEVMLADFTSASAYSTFSGGTDFESLDQTVERIKPSLSVRSLTSATAVESGLRDAFDDTDNPIIAISVCGFGDAAQHRDKHNLFGVSTGGRADVYVRNFKGLPVAKSLPFTGRMTGDPVNGSASYVITVDSKTVPGVISAYSVTDADEDALSSYKFSTRYTPALDNTWHDFDTSSDIHELANTIWRGMELTVSGVPVLQDSDQKEREFRVDVVALPAATDLQAVLDDDAMRNIGSDFIVRGPFIVNVSVNAVVRYKSSRLFDSDGAKTAIYDYINGTGFVGRLTRSEITSILRDYGAVSVDLHDENAMLYGYVRDANDVVHELSGDALDLSVIRDAKSLLTENTTVFVVESKNIQITTIPVN